jgi:hypothetical protein
VCTSDAIAKAKDMRRDPRVALSLTDNANPYRMAAIQGRVVEVRSDEGCRYMDPISVKYTGAPFPSRGPDRVCFVITVDKAAQRTLSFVHSPGNWHPAQPDLLPTPVPLPALLPSPLVSAAPRSYALRRQEHDGQMTYYRAVRTRPRSATHLSGAAYAPFRPWYLATPVSAERLSYLHDNRTRWPDRTNHRRGAWHRSCPSRS